MNTDSKEPKLTGIRPDQDEIARHQRQKSRSGNSTRQTAAAAPKSPPVIVKSSKVAPYAMFVAAVGLTLAGFTFWQLSMAQKSLLEADARIASLEGKLAMSDDESNASMTAMQAKLKWADSEIRKLWGVSYDNNRKAIAANKASLAEVKEGFSTVDTKIKTALESTKTEIQLVNELLEGQQATFGGIEKSNKEQTDKVRELDQKLAKLERLEDELKQRVATNEEAINAIDAFRRNVNQQLLQIRGN